MRPPSISAPPSSRIGTPLKPVAHRWSISRWTSIILFALWAFSTACQAAESPTPASLPPPSALALWDQGGAIADLDGDGRADLALVRKDGWGRKGIEYRIDFQLSAGGKSRSISVSAEEGGLQIAARDVDADGDLDLVVTSAKSSAVVGVWINDGHGLFTPSDPATYARSIWTEGLRFSSNGSQETFPPAVFEWQRFCTALSAGPYFCKELASERRSLFPAVANPRRIPVNQPQTRAPPAASFPR